MLDIKEIEVMVKKQLDEWDKEGILEEKLKEYGYSIIERPSDKNQEDDKT